MCLNFKFSFPKYPHIREVRFYPTQDARKRLRYLTVLQKSRRNLVHSRVRVARIFTVSLNCLRVPFWAGNGRFARLKGPGSHRRRSWASRNEWSRFRTTCLSPIRSINANVPHLWRGLLQWPTATNTSTRASCISSNCSYIYNIH